MAYVNVQLTPGGTTYTVPAGKELICSARATAVGFTGAVLNADAVPTAVFVGSTGGTQDIIEQKPLRFGPGVVLSASGNNVVVNGFTKDAVYA